MWRFTLLAIVLTFQPLLASQKLVGTVAAPAALQRVQSFCVETRNTPGDDSAIIRLFLLEQNKPNGKLRDLPWKLLPDCTAGKHDAVVTISFVPDQVLPGITQPPEVPGTPPTDDWIRLKTTLVVYDAASARVIYRVQAIVRDVASSDEGPAGASRSHNYTGLHDAFKALIGDLRQLSGAK